MRRVIIPAVFGAVLAAAVSLSAAAVENAVEREIDGSIWRQDYDRALEKKCDDFFRRRQLPDIGGRPTAVVAGTVGKKFSAFFYNNQQDRGCPRSALPYSHAGGPGFKSRCRPTPPEGKLRGDAKKERKTSRKEQLLSFILA